MVDRRSVSLSTSNEKSTGLKYSFVFDLIELLIEFISNSKTFPNPINFHISGINFNLMHRSRLSQQRVRFVLVHESAPKMRVLRHKLAYHDVLGEISFLETISNGSTRQIHQKWVDLLKIHLFSMYSSRYTKIYHQENFRPLPLTEFRGV